MPARARPHIKVRRAEGFAIGDKIAVGTPTNHEVVTVTAVAAGSRQNGAGIDFTPALARAHIGDEWVVSSGTGLDLAAPLKFSHAANLPFSNRGTGISFQPATAFAHSSNEPVQPLGTGAVLDKPLTSSHAIDAVVSDAAVTTAGYQGMPAPNQWFGGPNSPPTSPTSAEPLPSGRAAWCCGMPSGLVVDSLNYGSLVDPWAAEGYQAASGLGLSGCFAPAPGPVAGFGPTAQANATTVSAGRFPDGAGTGSNCADFLTQAGTTCWPHRPPARTIQGRQRGWL